MAAALSFVLSLFLLSYIEVLLGKHLVDLSYTYNNQTLNWPTERKERFRFTKREKYDSPHYEANSFSVAEHTGTHIDAPRHFVAGGYGVARIPLSRLIGLSVVINVTEQARLNSDLQIGEVHFREHEKKFGRIPDDSIVLLYTGFGKFWPNAALYFGTATNNTDLLHFPGLDPSGATWLLNNRKIKSIGIDTASIDYGQSKDYQSHRILFAQNVPAFENVANLDKVPAKGAMVYALPMKIGEGTGGPLRIVATWDDNQTSAGPILSCSLAILLLAIMSTFIVI
ncbi:kynurenine formamidase-like isoform X2 [Rhopilema esculentum]|uniref:kynurenine formamidase-like isoform X2 n=1 Tax=Rhopilema esculentum TaxID=499914 RepID=UPI0031E08F9F